MRILILGGQGRLGRACERALTGVGDVSATGRDDFDISKPEAVARAFDRYRPGVVINAAAYTDVEGAQAQPELAWSANVLAPKLVAQACSTTGALLIHVSTDFVFDGNKGSAYTETDATAPAGAYAMSKLQGEQAVLESGCDALVLRTSWLYGDPGGDFVDKVLQAAFARTGLRMVADQYGCPTWSGRLAAVIRALLLGDEPDAALRRLRAHPGVYHACASGEASRLEWARLILEVAADVEAAAGKLRATADRIEAVTSAEFASAVARPARSSLDCAKLQATFGIRMPHWRDDLVPYLRRRTGELALRQPAASRDGGR
jgi:dTDP-4-dehydrorhamnose reductase